MTTEIVQYENPGALMTRATDVAGVCREIVKRTAQRIQGRKFVRAEGWQSIAAAYGCVASAVKVERIDGGVRAVGELRRIADGALVATAEGFVGEDEATWFGGKNSYGKELPKRPDFAIRAMAQTRAISRVCRSAFAFVVVLIDEHLSTTPAEEMQGVYPEEHDQPAAESHGGASAVADILPASKTQSPAPDDTAGEPLIKKRDLIALELCGEANINYPDASAKAWQACNAIGWENMSERDWESWVAMMRRTIARRQARKATEAPA